MILEHAALRWLWLEQNCLVVLEQRTPFHMAGQPDVIGVTKGRFITEIEIKRSVSDFRADKLKPHRANREHHLKSMPRLFYYLTPETIADKVHQELPEWAGLMVLKKVNFREEIIILKRSPVNKEAIKLSLKKCARLARMMTNHMMGLVEGKFYRMEAASKLDSLCHVDYYDAKNGTFDI